MRSFVMKRAQSLASTVGMLVPVAQSQAESMLHVAELKGRMEGQRGQSMTSFVIGIAVAALVAAIILPIAFGQFFSVDTSSWDAQTILIWGIIPLVVILAVVLWFLNKASKEA